MDEPVNEPIIGGLILAGGQSRRMGGTDKCFAELGAKPLIAHAIDRAKRQVSALVIGAGGDPARFDALGLPVIADAVEAFGGPLTGILAGLEWAAAQGMGRLATFAADVPFFPLDLVARLSEKMAGRSESIAIAASGGQAHPVFGLWPVGLAPNLRAYLDSGESRSVLAFLDEREVTKVNFPAVPFDPFFNINTPEDLVAAGSMKTSDKHP